MNSIRSTGYSPSAQLDAICLEGATSILLLLGQTNATGDVQSIEAAEADVAETEFHPLVVEYHVAFAKNKLSSIGKHHFLP